MEMKLNTLSIRNFKGIKEYKLDPDGQSINILGDNGTGKTTLYDAFLWLLFGKNSENQATFDWKPLDKDGNELHHLETEVTAELEIDGQVKTLSRMTEENWVKKRGSASETFSGHNSTYKIDDLEVTMKDYNEFINEKVEERLFKILTDVSFFSTDKMEYKKGRKNVPAWRARRETLIGMVGDITDDDVIEKNNSLVDLKSLLIERPAEELKQLTSQKIGQINKQIRELPNRIDEVDRSLPNISDLNKENLIKMKETSEARIQEEQEKIAELRNSDEAVALKGKIAELKMEYREAELDHKQNADEPAQEFRERRSQLDDEIEKRRARISELRHQELAANDRNLMHMRETAEAAAKRQHELREQFFEVQKEKMPEFEEHQKTCPTCGQELQEEKLLGLRNKYEEEVEAFNSKQAEKLKEIQQEGKATAEKVTRLKEEIQEAEALNKKIEKEIVEEEEKRDAAEAAKKQVSEEIHRIQEGQEKFEDTDWAKENTAAQKELEEKLTNAQGSQEEDIKVHRDNLKEHQENLERTNSKLRDIEFYNEQAERKQELIEQEQQLSVEYGKQEQVQHLLDEFTRTKVNLLTDTINDKFKLVKFKLFEEQVNGALNEICEVTVDGANYSTGLNNAAKINAGLDIIGTLMEHYGIQVPVWIDNAESINEILEIETQMITLAVSKHKNLRVEAAS